MFGFDTQFFCSIVSIKRLIFCHCYFNFFDRKVGRAPSSISINETKLFGTSKFTDIGWYPCQQKAKRKCEHPTQFVKQSRNRAKTLKLMKTSTSNILCDILCSGILYITHLDSYYVLRCNFFSYCCRLNFGISCPPSPSLATTVFLGAPMELLVCQTKPK